METEFRARPPQTSFKGARNHHSTMGNYNHYEECLCVCMCSGSDMSILCVRPFGYGLLKSKTHHQLLIHELYSQLAHTNPTTLQNRRIRNVQIWLRHSVSYISNCWLRPSATSIQHSASRTQHRAFPASNMQHSASSISGTHTHSQHPSHPAFPGYQHPAPSISCIYIYIYIKHSAFSIHPASSII